MATTKTDTPEAEEQMRELAANLRMYRQRLCLLFVSRHLVHSAVKRFADSTRKGAGHSIVNRTTEQTTTGGPLGLSAGWWG
jgi:hypothetical protein